MAYLERLTGSAAPRGVTLFAVVAAAYVAGAELSWHSFGSGLAFGFPPAGVTVAAMLLTDRGRWPIVIAAIVVCEVGVDLQHHVTVPLALGSALANVVEPVVGASSVRRFCRSRQPDLATGPGLIQFVAGAVVLGPLAGGLVGATVNWLHAGGSWLEMVLQWWAGDGIAVLVIGAPILLWAQRRALVASRWPELAGVVLLTAGLSVVAFRAGEAPFLLFLPILAWAAFRLGDLGVVLAGTAFAAVANYLTAAGYGNLTHLGLSSPATVAVTQAYIAIVVLMGWVLAQEVTGRASAQQDRDTARVQQEVAEARRTAAELGAVLADAATVSSVGEQVSAAVRERLGAAHVVINVLARDGQRFEQLAGHGAAAQVAAMTAAWTIHSDAPGPRAVRDRAAVYLPDRTAPGSGFADAQPVGEALGLRASAAHPLLTEVGALGYLGVWWDEPHETTAVEREYLQAMAETTSRALERARLREAEQRERARIEILSELTRRLAAALTPEAIGEVVADRVRAALGGADALSLAVISADGQRLEVVTAVGHPEEVRERFPDLSLSVPAAATDAARTGRPVLIKTPGEYERRYPGPHVPAVVTHAASWIAWPLRVGARTVGSIGVAWKNPQQFEPGQLAFIAAVADLLGQALVRARVYADEHAIAAVLQRAVMPKTAAVIPGLDIGTCYRQAGTTQVVGGDWYDVLGLPAGRAYVAVGDVVGHGIAAAEDMTQLRNAGRALAIEGHGPASLLRELAEVTAWATSGKFATMAAAVVEPAASLVSYATAGHPPILVRRAGTGSVEVLPQAGGPAFYEMKDAAYSEGQTAFGRGDIMLMYTDGLVERRGEDILKGVGRVAEELRTWRSGAPLDDLCDHLVRSVAPEPQLDDVCVLAVGRPRTPEGPDPALA
ncbi:MAG: SpoIIE family protein phosphatase [Actinobacteria bacterium]|nr:SpoIIE family protein phosphatase [Actinomycetota bacterium]